MFPQMAPAGLAVREARDALKAELDSAKLKTPQAVDLALALANMDTALHCLREAYLRIGEYVPLKERQQKANDKKGE